MQERRFMQPVYVWQLTQEKQAGIKKMLEELILHGCNGNKDEAEKYYGMSFEEAVRNGMDLKIADVDYLMVFHAEEYNSGKADEECRLADTAVISSILKETGKQRWEEFR